MFYITEESKASLNDNVDEFADSYARDTGVEELKQVKIDCPLD